MLKSPLRAAVLPANHFYSLSVQRFESLCSDIVRLVAELKKLPSRSEINTRAFDRFASFDATKQNGIIESLRACKFFLEECASDQKIRDSVGSTAFERTSLWKIFGLFGLYPPHDLLDKIEGDDVIEIYDRNFHQLYRNWRFIELCSYSIADVNTFEFAELYDRPTHITDQLVQLGLQVLNGEVDETKKVTVDSHILREKFSEDRLSFRIEQGIVAPLHDSEGQIIGLITTLKAIPLSN